MEDSNLLLRGRVLAYAENMWKRHINTIRSFIAFCKVRELSVFCCTPSVLNLYMLTEAKNGKSTGFINSFLDAFAFLTKFFDMPNYAESHSVKAVKRFVEKSTLNITNVKTAFGTDEVRKLFDYNVKHFGPVDTWPKLLLRTFTLAVFQHKTFCRFSDVSKVKLDDILFHADYFKIHISSSKTDQAAKGDYVYVAKVLLAFKILIC
jgi:hypothetical protein